MWTKSDVALMTLQNDIEGLIEVLTFSSDKEVKEVAILNLSDIGDPGDIRIFYALNNCAEIDPDMSILAVFAMESLQKRQAQAKKRVPAKRVEKIIPSTVKRWMVHRKLILLAGAVILIGLCVEMFWTIQLGGEFNPSIWTMLPLIIGPLLVLTLLPLGITGITKFRNEKITPLIEAVLKQNAKKVQARIESGDNIHETDATGQTALHWASKYKSVEIVQLLLDAGASTDAKDQTSTTPLQNAQQKANTEILNVFGEVQTKVPAQPQRKQIIHRKVLLWVGVLMELGICMLLSVLDLDEVTWISYLSLFCIVVGVIFIILAFIPKKKSTIGKSKTAENGIDKIAGQPTTSTVTTEGEKIVGSQPEESASAENGIDKIIDQPPTPAVSVEEEKIVSGQPEESLYPSKKGAGSVSMVDAMLVLCIHDLGLNVTPAAGAALKKLAKDALTNFDPSLVLDKDAYIRFGLLGSGAPGPGLSSEVLDTMPANIRMGMQILSGGHLSQIEKEAEENLPSEMMRLMQERGLNPDAYDLRSFKESPDPGVVFLWIAAVQK